jgi:S-adenosylmethionine:tRNA ribosyltransferase-isomerase
MRVDALHYELPSELIAQRPAAAREAARLLHLPPCAAPASPGPPPEHRSVSDLADLIPSGALIVKNDTRVIPARLLGRKQGTGGRVEIFLVRPVGAGSVEARPGESRPAELWRALGKAGKPLRFGADVEIPARDAPDGPRRLCVRLLGRSDEDGLLEVAAWTPSGEDVASAVRACGRVPIPPYIRRDAGPEDDDRYQTVYARSDGAVAAPTAGLHVTHGLLERLAAKGCELADVTLHVGLGTFQPVQVDDLNEHRMHAERFTVPPETADAVARARGRGAPVVSIGTTTTRALESAADPDRPGHVRATGRETETRLLIQPGYDWRVVDGLLTNFHLPRSTLLAMVCAFGGLERVLDAYAVAVRERYRFYSYGDAMLLWRAP